ncbi:hypothetical protein CBL_09294 [Carabus blaptoides fortunei]
MKQSEQRATHVRDVSPPSVRRVRALLQEQVEVEPRLPRSRPHWQPRHCMPSSTMNTVRAEQPLNRVAAKVCQPSRGNDPAFTTWRGQGDVTLVVCQGLIELRTKLLNWGLLQLIAACAWEH